MRQSIKQICRHVSSKTIFSQPSNNLSRKDIEKLTTSELLCKLGFIAQPNAGLVHWLPLGKGVLDNVNNIVRKRHNENKCVEVELSSISHSSIWDKTNRWNNNELFKIGEYCLAATAEEEITTLVTPYLNSYKKMPFIGYQITRKYRNEKRSRGGLLRGREFYMKDAYSFDIGETEALKSFNSMNETYEKIFNDLRLPWVKANADSGDIGGDLSYEWHIVSEIGEDDIVKCNNCGSCGNVERSHSIKGEDGKFVEESDVKYFLSKENELICIYFPKGRKLSMKFVKEEDLVDFNEQLMNKDEIINKFVENNEQNDGLVTIFRLIDKQVGPGTKMPDLPDNVKFNKNHMITFQELDITESQEGDHCDSCKEGTLVNMKGVEVGHTFYLGTKYSKPLEGNFIDKDNKKKPYYMGCYGIGISRIIGVIADILRDNNGLRWPNIIAPIQVSIINKNTKKNDDDDVKFEDTLVKELQNKNIRVENDDSDKISFGKKLNKSKMIGVPLQVIVGVNEGIVEIETRGCLFSEEFRKIKEIEGDKWGWEIISKSNGEKHIVKKEYASKVIEILLKDM